MRLLPAASLLACVLSIGGCLDRVDASDVACRLDTDCPTGSTCGPEGTCLPGTTRDPRMTCVAGAAGPTCTCPAELVAVDAYACRDKNACERISDPCGPFATCTPGDDDTITCTCNDGFTDDGTSGCVDIDECAVDDADQALCGSLGVHARCVNKPGHYECGCADGWRVLAGSCADVDECAENTDTCAETSTCVNRDGGFDCTCPAFLEPDGLGGCKDVDECATANPCERPWTCVNRDGQAPGCRCDPPYVEGDGACVTAWMKVAAGNDHTCAIRQDGRLFCWGANDRGQLGLGTPRPPSVDRPRATFETDTFLDVSAGEDSTCAVRADHTLWCWGTNRDGQLGTGTRTEFEPEPKQAGINDDWQSVSIGLRSACGIRTYGGIRRVHCWGGDDSGQTGLGNPQGAGPVLVPTRIPMLDGALDVRVASIHAIAITEDRGLACWGANFSSQCGIDPATSSSLRSPVLVPQASRVRTAAVGGSITCYGTAEAGGRTLWCMGEGPIGNVATGWRGVTTTPVRVGLADEWSDGLSVAQGSHVLAVKSAGGLFGWGDTDDAQLGDRNGGAGRPVAIPGVGDVFEVAAGRFHSCALKLDGRLYCWGLNGNGQTGTGTGGDRPRPVRVTDGPVDSIEGTDWAFAWCATIDGDLQCWGKNDGAGIVAAPGAGSRSAPSPRFTDNGFREVATGGTAACGVRSDGTLACWGTSGNGLTFEDLRVVNGTVRTITGDTDWAHVRLGFDHACATKLDGSLWCWGEDTGDGQMGTGRSPVGPTVSRETPVRIAGTTTFAIGPGKLSIRAGGGAAIGAGPDAGKLFVWGANDTGQAGTGDTDDRMSPVALASTGWTWVATGGTHVCGVRDGDLYCWGDCADGACGPLATETPTIVPTFAVAVADVERVAVGAGFTCFVNGDGTAACMGAGAFGQLGGGQFLTSVSGPVGLDTTGVTGTRWTHVAAIASTACGVRDDGSLYCWGAQDLGAVGDGSAWLPVPGLVTD